MPAAGICPVGRAIHVALFAVVTVKFVSLSDPFTVVLPAQSVLIRCKQDKLLDSVSLYSRSCFCRIHVC